MQAVHVDGSAVVSCETLVSGLNFRSVERPYLPPHPSADAYSPSMDPSSRSVGGEICRRSCAMTGEWCTPGVVGCLTNKRCSRTAFEVHSLVCSASHTRPRFLYVASKTQTARCNGVIWKLEPHLTSLVCRFPFALLNVIHHMPLPAEQPAPFSNARSFGTFRVYPTLFEILSLSPQMSS